MSLTFRVDVAPSIDKIDNVDLQLFRVPIFFLLVLDLFVTVVRVLLPCVSNLKGIIEGCSVSQTELSAVH